MNSDAPLLGVGKALSEARQAQGLNLADVAQQLKFMTRQLEALEAERFESLPGPTIARGMVRTYARFLKLDPEPLLSLMTGHVDTRDATPHLAARFSQPVPFSDNGRRSTVVYLGLSAVVLALVGGMAYQWRHERKPPEVVAAAKPPVERALPAPAPVAVPDEEPAPKEAAKIAPEAVRTPPEAAKTAPPQVASAEAPPKPAAKSTAKTASVTPQPALQSAPEPQSVVKVSDAKSTGPNRLVIRFEEAAWAEVTDSAGRQLVSSLNPAGSERVVRGRPPFNLVIGNAQHVKVSYNDRLIDLQPHVKVEVARFTIK
jgi:cytoskeleton protein RodZ